MRKNLRTHALSVFGLCFFVLLAIGSMETDSDTKRVQSQSPSYTLTANQLASEYKANEVAADAKYKGHIVVVSGTIQNIGKDIMDQAYVELGGQGFLDGVQCMFTKGEESSVARLSKGSQVTVKGEVSGKIGNVLLNKCSVQ